MTCTEARPESSNGQWRKGPGDFFVEKSLVHLRKRQAVQGHTDSLLWDYLRSRPGTQTWPLMPVHINPASNGGDKLELRVETGWYHVFA